MLPNVAEDVLMEIAGYEVQREIGRGGMSRIYLAVQRKFGRNVAIKVVSPDSTRDPQFKRRFVQEARIIAQLNHPHIVQVHDFGVSGDNLYLVMEYMRGGDLNDKLEKGMHMRAVLRVTKEIAGALDYAHEKGFLHRDIKPENILFREQGSAVLTDFGIAKLVDQTSSVTRHGTVVGTPEYMSPEQAAGHQLDGRSDIYSLGVVFYRMLVGDVPYRADSVIALGICHIQDPIPTLPDHLAPFQDVVNRFLAKQPEDRFQSGQEASDALDQIRSDGIVPNAVVKTNLVTTAEIAAISTPAGDPLAIRTEPRRRARKTKRRTTVVLSSMLFATVVGAGYFYMEYRPEWVARTLALAGIADDVRIEDSWEAAEALRTDPNQSLAAIVAAYSRILDLDPGHIGAAEAIERAARQWKDDIQMALDAEDDALAEAKLDESYTVFPDDADLMSLSKVISDRKQAAVLLAQIGTSPNRADFTDDSATTSAIQIYQEVLRLHPGNAEARAELDRMAGYFARQAAIAAQAGDVTSAMDRLGRAATANPQFSGLGIVRDEIRNAETLQGEIDNILQEAGALRASGYLIDPPAGNAAEIYHRVLATDPNNAIAGQGLAEVAAQVSARFAELLGNGRFDEVQLLLDRSVAVGLGDTPVDEMKAAYELERARIDRVDAIVEEALALLQAGFITKPVDRNAVTRLREVLRLDPGNTIAQENLVVAAERLATVAREAQAVGLEEDARLYLDLALTVTPDVADWRALRDSWVAKVAQLSPADRDQPAVAQDQSTPATSDQSDAVMLDRPARSEQDQPIRVE